MKFRICSLKVVSGCSLVVVGCFRSFLAHGGSFQVVSCPLWAVSSHLLLVVGRFRWFLVRCRSFLARCR